MLKKLTPSRAMTTNVRCGLVKGLGERVVGCGKSGMFIQYHYQNGNCTSTVSLCDGCVESAKDPQYPADEQWHRYNVENDESVF